MVKKIVSSKNALPTTASLWVEIMFQVKEIKRKKYVSQGQSGFYNNARLSRKKMLNAAIYNAYKKVFPTGTYTMINIIILSYHFNYLVDRYQVVEKNDKYYERFRDTKKGRTRYYVINDKNLLKPDESYDGVKW